MKLYGKFDGSAITDISCNLRAFGWFDDVYYTTKEAVSMYDVYVPFEKNWDALSVMVLKEKQLKNLFSRLDRFMEISMITLKLNILIILLKQR